MLRSEDPDFFVLEQMDTTGALSFEACDDSTARRLQALAYGESRKRRSATLQLRGRHPKDLVWAGDVHVYAMSPAFVETLRTCGATGWDSFEIRHKSSRNLPAYSGLVVAGRAGPVRWADATIEHDPDLGSTLVHVRGLPIAPESWDGKDVFAPRNYLVPIVTAKVFRALTDAKLTGFELTPTEEFRVTIGRRLIVPEG